METLGMESPYDSAGKKLQQSLREGERALMMMDGMAASNMPPLMKMPRSCTPWLYVIEGETCQT